MLCSSWNNGILLKRAVILKRLLQTAWCHLEVKRRRTALCQGLPSPHQTLLVYVTGRKPPSMLLPAPQAGLQRLILWHHRAGLAFPTRRRPHLGLGECFDFGPRNHGTQPDTVKLNGAHKARKMFSERATVGWGGGRATLSGNRVSFQYCPFL